MRRKTAAPVQASKERMELGLYTFVERSPHIPAGQRMRNLMEEVELADQVGLELFGIGEHHRPDYMASTPAVVLAAASQRTKQIRLTSAVTVLSSDDPVRVFQEFATVDLLSGGRAEIMVGRGSFIESYPLFGYDLNLYDALFSEKLDLLLKLRESEHITWSGRLRAPLTGQGVYPRPVQERLPVWIAVGGTPQSAVRAGTLGLPMALAIIGGMPERFAPFVDIYREAGARAGHDPATLRLGINSHGYIADTSQRVADEFYGPLSEVMNQIGAERGWPPQSRAEYDRSRQLRHHLFAGSPQEVVDKILFQHEIFRHDRFLLQNTGTIPHAQMLRSIELYGTRVAPAVRRALGGEHQPGVRRSAGASAKAGTERGRAPREMP
jgi:probable LLM family oxidoreductase